MWYIFYFGRNNQTSENGFSLKAYPFLGYKICGVIMNHRYYRMISALMYKFHSLLFKDGHYLAHFLAKFLSNSPWKHQKTSLLNKSFRYVMLCYAIMLCYVMLCYMLCYVTLSYVMLCYVMLCYVMLKTSFGS